MHASLYEFFVSRVLFSCLKLNFFFFFIFFIRHQCQTHAGTVVQWTKWLPCSYVRGLQASHESNLFFVCPKTEKKRKAKKCNNCMTVWLCRCRNVTRCKLQPDSIKVQWEQQNLCRSEVVQFKLKATRYWPDYILKAKSTKPQPCSWTSGSDYGCIWRPETRLLIG